MDSIANTLHEYARQKSESVLFVHFDKNVYTNNDQVWFTGYLLKGIAALDHYHTLYVSLVNNKDSTVVLQDKFLIDKGVCFGSLTLPDSIPSGSYRFVVNTNIQKNKQRDGTFIQPVSIRSTTISPLAATLSVFKKYDVKTKNGTALLKVSTSDNRFVENAEIKYTIGRKQIIKSGTAKSSVIGEFMIDYPADQINAQNNLLTAVIRKGAHTTNVSYDLPFSGQQQYLVNFFPEGGYLVKGLTSSVGIEIKDLNGVALKATGVLYQNNKAIDTVATNSLGMGSFIIRPDDQSVYAFKLLKSEGINESVTLPAVLKKGVVISSNQSVVNNTLRVRIQATDQQKVHVVLHNFSGIFSHAMLNLTPNKEQPVRFELDSVPIGLNAVTVLDSLYRPLAERIFFSHYDQLNKLEVTTDRDEYATRSKVELKLNLLANQEWKMGLVSVACVQANRLAITNEKNIVDYSLLQQNLGELPVHLSGLRFQDVAYLNDLLLIKGWRRFSWPLPATINTTEISSTELTGQVKKGKRVIKEPLTFNTIAGSNVNTLVTDSIGKFVVPYDYLLSSEKGKVWLTLQNKNLTDYTLDIVDPAIAMKRDIERQGYIGPSSQMSVLNDGEFNIGITSGIKLKEVTIKANKDESLMNAYANECGDYVCPYNILNCPNHPGNPGNKAPVKGKIYGNGGAGGTIMYQGCTGYEAKPNVYILNGIKQAKEFYISDVSNRNEPINFATVYWNYQTQIEKGKETSVSFNTGDLTGSFKIVVQGIADSGVVYGEKLITIHKP